MERTAPPLWEQAVYYLNIGICFLYAAGFLGFPNRVLLVWVAAYLIFHICTTRKNPIDIPSVLLFLAMLAYACAYHYYKPDKMNLYGIMDLTLTPTMLYLWGRAYIRTEVQGVDTGKRVKSLLLAAAFGLFVHGLLNIFTYLRYGYTSGNTRIWADFWTGKNLYATQHMFYFLLISALVFYAIYTYKNNRFASILILSCAITGNVFFFYETTRTVFLEMLLVFILAFFLYGLLNRRHAKKFLILLAVLAALVIGFLIMAYFNIGHIRWTDFYWVMFHRDGGILGNKRFVMQRGVLADLLHLAHPWGGFAIDLGDMFHTHNCWLQFYYVGGLVPFLLLIAFTICTLADIVRLIARRKDDAGTLYLLTSLYAVNMIFYLIERPFDRVPLFFVYWTLLCGVTAGYVKERTKSIKKPVQKPISFSLSENRPGGNTYPLQDNSPKEREDYPHTIRSRIEELPAVL